MTISLEKFCELVECSFVGGELVALVNGKHYSVGRRKHGVFTYSQRPEVKELLASLEGDPTPRKAKGTLQKRRRSNTEDMDQGADTVQEPKPRKKRSSRKSPEVSAASTAPAVVKERAEDEANSVNDILGDLVDGSPSY